jgi:FKBP-type peptidyl-prolyl cis-trans isomerase
VHYRGTTIDGEEFDSTYESERPIEIPLDRVIPGWSEGLRMMKEGGKAKLYIPPDLAYGEGGTGSTIGPSAVIVFEVELLAILRVDAETEDDYSGPGDE